MIFSIIKPPIDTLCHPKLYFHFLYKIKTKSPFSIRAGSHEPSGTDKNPSDTSIQSSKRDGITPRQCNSHITHTRNPPSIHHMKTVPVYPAQNCTNTSPWVHFSTINFRQKTYPPHHHLGNIPGIFKISPFPHISFIL